jgi:hypothetical protein
MSRYASLGASETPGVYATLDRIRKLACEQVGTYATAGIRTLHVCTRLCFGQTVAHLGWL